MRYSQWFSKIIIVSFCLVAAIKCVAQRHYLALADSVRKLGENNLAIQWYNLALTDSIHLSKLELANALMRRGNSLCDLDQPKEAIRDYLQALPIFASQSEQERVATLYGNLANAFAMQIDDENSEKYYKLALAIGTQIKDTSKIIENSVSLGIIQFHKKQYSTAITIYKNILVNYDSAIDESTKSIIYLNLGNCYVKKPYDSAYYFYREALPLAERSSDSGSIATLHLNLGDLYKDDGKLDLALESLQNSLALSNQFLDSGQLALLHHNLGDVYDSLRRYHEAYYYRTSETEINKRLYDHEKLRLTKELETKYENLSIKQQLALETTQKELNLKIVKLSLLGLVMALGLAGVIYANFIGKRKANKLLQLKNDRIETLNEKLDASNQVKTKLFSTVSHDLRGPISSIYAFLQMQSTSIDNDARKLLNDSISKQTEQLMETLEDLLIWSKSQLHQFVPAQETVNVQSILSQLQDFFYENIRSRGLTLSLSGFENMKIKTDLNMFTIVLRNLLGNAIKYAPAGSDIRIDGHQQANNFSIEVVNSSENSHLASQNLQASAKLNSNTTGLGLTLIQEFAEKISAEVKYHFSENAVIAKLTIPTIN